jgi:selenocysteine lyase/cysteine desulfurase
LKASFEAIADHEQKLLHALMGYLLSDKVRERGVRVVGREAVDRERVPTVSFVVRGEKPIKSQDVVKVFDEAGNVGSI